jgi:GT2 family glycosyltransferase
MTGPFWKSPASIQIQSVLYHADAKSVLRGLRYAEKAAEFAIKQGTAKSVEFCYGDCSAEPVFKEGELGPKQEELASLSSIRYEFFAANLGSAAGHNRLAEGAQTDFTLIMNPDVLMAPTCLDVLLRAFQNPSCGLAEGRQLPIEHPKDYAPETGETSWASTACALIPTSVMKALNGFDSKSFFLYCDDVDFSWRVRLSGLKVIFCPTAAVFHGKRLSQNAQWVTSSAERYYSAEASLMMTHKWSRPDLCAKYLTYFEASGDEFMEKAAQEFRIRKGSGNLPAPIDPDHAIGQFVGTNYAAHRYLV